MMALVARAAFPPAAELREVDEPAPAAHEALVAVRATSVNRGEVEWLSMMGDGWCAGWDLAGVVRRTAADGSGPPTGARVAGFLGQGAWAQRVAVPTDRLAVVPDSVGFAGAAAVPVAGLTALRAVQLGGSLQGRRVLVTGAAGGVGRFAVQLAALGGAEVVAVARDGERARGLADLGSDAIVRDPTEDGGYFDLVCDGVGGGSLAAALRVVAPGGDVVSYGNASGAPVSFDAAELFMRAPGARLHALRMDATGGASGFASDLAMLLGLTAAGRLDPQVALETTWRESEQAFAAVMARRVAGKAVLRLD